MSLLEKRLTKKWADEVITENNRLVIAIIHDLQEMGKQITAELELKDYEKLEWFLDEHDHGNSPFDSLEGKADREGSLFVLKDCPMTKLLNAVMVNGKLPEFYQKIVDKYLEIYKTKGAILHPFCIVHQVIRATVGEHIKINGKPLKVYQVACRSMSSGKIVYATEGTSRVEMEKPEIDKKIDKKACMYLIKA
jgi:ASC-1-like (ASCH) protein